MAMLNNQRVDGFYAAFHGDFIVTIDDLWWLIEMSPRKIGN